MRACAPRLVSLPRSQSRPFRRNFSTPSSKYADIVRPVLDNGTDGSVPDGALALEAEHYVSEESYKREKQVIFSREWMCLGLTSDLLHPGAYRAIDFAGYSIFAMRDRNGLLKGFHNVCRHRAGPLVSGERGQCDIIRCRYHGWVYDTDGRLRRAPEFGPKAPDIANLSLMPVRIEEWQGLLFCNLSLDPPPLSEELKDLEPIVAPYALDKMRTLKDWVEPIACNWKTYTDNYMEGYHIRDVHPLLNQSVSMKDYRVFVGKRGRFAIHSVPVKAGQTEFEGALNLYKSSASIERIMPTGPRSMQLHYTYVSNENTAHEQAERARAGSELLTAEDKRICEMVQRNLESGMYKAGPLSPRHENGVFAFHQWVRTAYAKV